ncbi:hypothetical protein FB107DRAFT_276393 [Schizophyllum commune]
MLPKVASHILHTSTRAAAAVQNQAAFRNVFHQSPGFFDSTGAPLVPSSDRRSSNWGGHGGAKYNGSRFSHSFAGAPGRAVTQAHAQTGADVSVTQEDAEDVHPLRHPKPRRAGLRLRSQSVSVHPLTLENASIVQALRLHARSRHTLAAADADKAVVDVEEEEVLDAVPPRLSRRNSTSSISSDPQTPASPLLVRRNSTVSVDTASGKQLPPIDVAPTPARQSTPVSEAQATVLAAKESGDALLAAEAVSHFLSTVTSPSTRDYNLALETIYATRREGEPLTYLLDVYNRMIRASVLPNLRTYLILSEALLVRDAEVHNQITALETRINRAGEQELDAQVEGLRAETNFVSALSMFHTIVSLNGASTIPMHMLTAFLRSCAAHGDASAAVTIFGQVEARKDEQLAPSLYGYLIQVYAANGQLENVRAVFEEYQTAAKAGRLALDESGRREHVQVYNQMIEASFRCGEPQEGVALLETMMSGTAELVPSTASSTFATVIGGFVRSGDISTAQSWFDRLLQQADAPPADPYAPMPSIARPDRLAWDLMLDGLADAARADASIVDDINALFARLADLDARGEVPLRDTDCLLVFSANLARAHSHPAPDVLAHVIRPPLAFHDRVRLSLQAVATYLDCGHVLPALDVFATLNAMVAQDAPDQITALQVVQHAYTHCMARLDAFPGLVVPFDYAMDLAKAELFAQLPQSHERLLMVDTAFTSQPPDAALIRDLPTEDRALVLAAALASVETGRAPASHLISVLGSLAPEVAVAKELFTARTDLLGRLVHAFQGSQQAKEELRKLGDAYAGLLSDAAIEHKVLAESLVAPTSKAEAQAPPPVPDSIVPRNPRVDHHVSRHIHELTFHALAPKTREAFDVFINAAKRGRLPNAQTTGRLIESCGRARMLDEVRQAYSVAQSIFKVLGNDQQRQMAAWFAVENSMVIAYAHAGDFDTAYQYRQRMIEQGGYPSADAYAALIMQVKDTTDDTSNALALFNESQIGGVRPNLFLYNNIISKLSKARKTDTALELFQAMKEQNINPSSVTYGTVISACARVGDVASSELLFEEMEAMPNFRPKAAPYNTMMQLFTMTKPNRERALAYYEKLKASGAKENEHTWKLLLDVYGNVEPVNREMMEKIKDQLLGGVGRLTSAQFAALINSYGSAQKNLDEALRLFTTVPESRLENGHDAIVYEALFNVFVTHKRPDLLGEYMRRMRDGGVRMTAYIANALIKGYSRADDLESARRIFESLSDPPYGVAAPGNHVAHDATMVSARTQGDGTDAVYREPSTWEEMVRAELGAQNRDRVSELLQRLRSRGYPDSVVRRIEGIMSDPFL